MLTKLGRFFSVLTGTITVLVVLILIALIGAVVAFVAYFLMWGVMGLLVIGGIWFLIWAAIDEYKDKTPHDTDDPGP